MLTLQVPIGEEMFDEAKNAFVTSTFTLELEHSLVSLSKWESKFEKPFLGDGDKTTEETLWYVKAMTLTPNVPQEVYDRLTDQNVLAINEYINANHTATTFREEPNKPGSREIITAEIITNWMIALKIPHHYESRHLNSLFALVRTVNAKNQTPKKMSRREMAERNRALNAQRRQELGTRG